MGLIMKKRIIILLILLGLIFLVYGCEKMNCKPDINLKKGYYGFNCSGGW